MNPIKLILHLFPLRQPVPLLGFHIDNIENIIKKHTDYPDFSPIEFLQELERLNLIEVTRTTIEGKTFINIGNKYNGN